MRERKKVPTIIFLLIEKLLQGWEYLGIWRDQSHYYQGKR